MKRVLSITLSLCMLLMVAGCGGSSDSGNTDIPYEKGVLTEDGFESKYIGLRFTTPDGFIMATQEEINSAMEAGGQLMDMDTDSIDYAKLTTAYEMMAAAPLGSPNVIVMVEKLSLSGMTTQQYFDALKTQLDATAIDYTFGEGADSVEVAGQSYERIIATASVSGQTLSQSYMMRKNGDRMIGIIATYQPETEADLEALMSGFAKY